MNIVVVTYVQAVAAVKQGGRGSLAWVLFADVVTDSAALSTKPQIYANLRKSRAYSPALSPA